jgi:hypothetical protein
MADDNEPGQNLVPRSTKVETALDVAGVVASAVPWIGGPVSAVLSGMSFGRKFNRVREVLDGLSSDLRDFKSEASEQYVRTEEFEELLEATLKRAAEERSAEKRAMYRSFLSHAIQSPGAAYDEQLRYLRTLDELQPDHVRVLEALSRVPEGGSGMMGSPSGTLIARLPDMPRERLDDLVNHLNDMRLTNLTSLHAMMTFHGAQDLRHAITPYGRRFLESL